jgi:hypothetical protein
MVCFLSVFFKTNRVLQPHRFSGTLNDTSSTPGSLLDRAVDSKRGWGGFFDAPTQPLMAERLAGHCGDARGRPCSGSCPASAVANPNGVCCSGARPFSSRPNSPAPTSHEPSPAPINCSAQSTWVPFPVWSRFGRGNLGNPVCHQFVTTGICQGGKRGISGWSTAS